MPDEALRLDNKYRHVSFKAKLTFMSLIILILVKVRLVNSIFFFMGSSGCVVLAVYWCIFAMVPREPYKPRIRSNIALKLSRLMDKERRNLDIETTKLNEPIFEESFMISETINDTIDLIVKEFIESWYNQISGSRKFTNSIKLELRYIFRNLEQRLRTIDFAKFLVSRVLPMLNDHFDEFIKAELAVRSKVHINKAKQGLKEFDFAVARYYDKGNLHPGVTISIDAPNDVNEKTYLRKSIKRILPYLLSSKESNSEMANSLVTEILACTILSNILQMLSEADFYNMAIVRLVGDNLKHRDQVKRLRAALDEHTRSLSNKISARLLRVPNYKKSLEQLEKEFFDINFTEDEFNQHLDQISKMDSMEQLMQLQSQLQILRKSSKFASGGFSERRVIALENSVKHRLMNEDLLKKRSIKRMSGSDSESLSLSEILYRPLSFESFYNFMQKRGRESILGLWKDIENIKAPLEDSLIGENGEIEIGLSLKFSNLDDIKKIYHTYFCDPHMLIESDIVETVKDLIKSEGPEQLKLYQKSRKLIFKLQNELYDRMNEDFSLFKQSNDFRTLIKSNALDSNRANSDDLKSLFYDVPVLEDDGGNEEEVISPAVVKAVQDAFTQIMTNSRNADDPIPLLEKSLSSASIPNQAEPTYDIQKNIFGDGSSLFGDEPKTNIIKQPKLFDDYTDESEADSDSTNFDSDNQLQSSLELENGSDSGLQLFLAAPGNLSLSEEITKLGDDIERLSDQQAILDPLLRKAELTNNISELKILKKSKLGLEREIKSKELQRQQYIVQENDNSLYGRSRVCIQSYISDSENGKEFTLYIIEVQKLSHEDPDVITAGWIVARRFSQFFKLNEYLKSKFPQISNIKFPKRKVLVLKFQQRQLAELRKSALEEYLKELIKIPEVCYNKAFRSFLSSENFNLRKNQPFEDGLNVTYRKTKNDIETVANKFYSGLSNRVLPSFMSIEQPSREDDTKVIVDIKGMQNELKQYDDISNNEARTAFVKPICDILISIFRLNMSKTWLRGRALLVILQQIFGTTIEKKIYDQVDFLLQTNESLLDLCIFVKDLLFPNGKFRDPPAIRTIYDRVTTKHEANVLLSMFMNETCSKIFGLSNTNYAVTNIFGMVQNEYLNKHIVLEIFDGIVSELFPEI
ncbi:uncharacterized protein PRCAT00004595001 [Priceomyces carsonii]|uniref:uncharacterized protein n=1 Tax=Priceomyces carsonii TaxID=28549 RepID=UPI002ED85974|nr:unnamed protein product [Priceomyces carsonii]